MSVLRTLVLFALAALAEIGGAWLIWQGVRERRGIAFIGAGIAALALYGFVAGHSDGTPLARIAPQLPSELLHWTTFGLEPSMVPVAGTEAATGCPVADQAAHRP